MHIATEEETTQAAPGHELLTVAEVAQLLRVKRAQGYRLVTGGVVPSVRIGARGWRVPREAWNAWLAQQTQLALANVKTTTYKTASAH
jgi:excisionase family DNA binding protein